MALDHNIILAGLRNQDPGTGFLQAMQMGQQFAQNRQVQQMNAMRMQEAERKQQSESAVRSAFARHSDPATGRINYQGALSELASTGYADVAHELGTTLTKNRAEVDYKTAQAERERAQRERDIAETGAKKFETLRSHLRTLGAYAGGVKKTLAQYGPDVAAQAWGMMRNQAIQQGMDPSLIPEQFSPQAANWLEASAIDAEKRLEIDWNREKEGNVDRRHQETLGVTKRGQDMANYRAGEANKIAAAGNIIKGATDIRKEFTDLPQVKNYTAAFPSFAAIKNAAKGTNPQSDINLIYGVAKLYDPNSVVREGEYNTIAGSQAIPEQIKGWAQRLAGGGRLTPETKKQILAEAENRLKTYEDEYTKAMGSYRGIAQERGIDPKSVFARVGRISPTGSRVISREDLAETKAKAKAKGISGAQVEADIRSRGWEIE